MLKDPGQGRRRTDMNSKATARDAPVQTVYSPSTRESGNRADTSARLAPMTSPGGTQEWKQVRNSSTGDPESERAAARRRFVFRCVRLTLAGGMLLGAGTYARNTFLSLTSERAYISAELTELRAPIDGQLLLEPVRPGTQISAGTVLFRVENLRYGNAGAMSQFSWVRELAERLKVENEDAVVRYQQQERLFQIHEKLYREKLISALAFLEEETKLALARTAMTNKQAQLGQAEARCWEVERQLALQKEAVVAMPFDGTAWSIAARNGAQVSTHESVLQIIDPERIWVDAFFDERHAGKFAVSTPVVVRTADGKGTWQGRVESIRGGVGRIPSENFAAGGQGESMRRRISVRVKMDPPKLYDASQFFGVGRSVVVTLRNHE